MKTIWRFLYFICFFYISFQYFSGSLEIIKSLLNCDCLRSFITSLCIQLVAISEFHKLFTTHSFRIDCHESRPRKMYHNNYINKCEVNMHAMSQAGIVLCPLIFLEVCYPHKDYSICKECVTTNLTDPKSKLCLHSILDYIQYRPGALTEGIVQMIENSSKRRERRVSTTLRLMEQPNLFQPSNLF